jgi:hypothetical protein
MGYSICMVMKCESQNRETKTNEQEIDKLSLHDTIISQNEKKSKWGMHCIFWKEILYS